MSYLNKIKQSKYVRSAFIYAGVNGSVAILPLLLIPVITRFVEVEEYGLYIIFVVIAKLLCSGVSLGYVECIAREFTSHKKDEFKYYLSNCIITVFTWSLFIFILTSWLGELFESYTKIPSVFYYLLFFVAFNQFVNNCLLTIFQMSSKAIQFGFIRIGVFVIEYVSVLCALYFFDLGLTGLILSYVLSHIIVGISALIFLIRTGLLGANFSFDRLWASLRTSLPLIPHELGGILLSFSDRLMIGYYLNPGAVGVYAIGYQFGQVVSLVDTAVNKAWIPWLFKELGNAKCNFRAIFISCLIYIFALIGLALFVGFAGSWIIELIYSSAYLEGKNVTIWIAMAFSSFGIYKVAAAFVFYTRNTFVLGIATPSIVIINLVLDYFLIPLHGIVGAAEATFISFLLLAIIISSFSVNLIRKQRLNGLVYS